MLRTKARLLKNPMAVLLPVFLISFIPQMASWASQPEVLVELALFGVVALAWLLGYLFWLHKHQALWAKITMSLGTWVLALGFTAIFSSHFSNAYLSLGLATQIIFALFGARFGIAILG